MTKKSHRKKRKEAPPVKKIAKWTFVAAVWLGIGLALLTAWYAAELPGIVANPKFERKSSIVMHDNTGETFARFGNLKGISIDVKDMPPHLVQAVIAIEDRRFYRHHGLDPVGLLRAVASNLRLGHVAQGGSTITQQLAKNLFLSHERTLKRKIQEALLALWLERQLTKDEILSAYLNRVYFGAGAYGVDAASRAYFDKPAKDITLYEAAVLAGLLKAPSRYSPSGNPGLAAKRAKVVLAAMEDAGYISKKDAARAGSVTPRPTRKPGEGGADRYFADWVAGELDRLMGTADKDLVVETTLDPVIQSVAEAALARALRAAADRNVSQGAVLVMDTGGRILAMTGGKNYAASSFNRATQARRPPGSAFKPFVYLTALEQGWRPGDTVEDTPITSGRYRPENFGGEYAGQVSLEDALAHSLNTAAVRLAGQVGIGRVIEVARRAGIKRSLPANLSVALGSPGIPMIEMAAAYATLADGGRLVQPYVITKITAGDKNELAYLRKDLYGRQVFDPGHIRDLTSMMTRVIEQGTGQRARIPARAAGKTGTSQDFRDAWFIGFADGFITAVWLGNDDNSPMKGVTGGSFPADIWRETMTAALDRGHRQKMDGGGGDGGSFSSLIQRLLSFNE